MTTDASLITTAPAPRRARRRVPVLVALAALVLLAVAVLVVAGTWLAPQNPAAQNLFATLRPPGGGHLLGTDDLGRDVLSRLIAGTQPAISGPLAVAVSCALIGGSLGLLAGFRGGVTDTLVGRLVDVVYTLPGLLVAIVLVGVAGGGYWLTALILILLSFPYQTRLCRAATLGQSRLTYVDAARTMGLPARRIMFGHLLPNIAPTLLTAFLLDFTSALIAYSALDYLGLGVTPGSADWGGMIATGQSYITANPWMSIGPAVAIIATAASATLLGDWAYDRLSQRKDRP
jgi:ABC-type dipeptide/oligopeptide/nickel transport system permease subunit